MDNNVPNDLVCGFAHELVNLEDTEEHGVQTSPNEQVFPFVGNSSQVSKTPPMSSLIACKKSRVDGKPNKRCKRLNDESIELAKALFKFAKSSTKIEVMKFEIQKEIALKTMESQLAMVWMFVEIMRSNGNGSGGGGGSDGSGNKD
jgi:hypothetical protein